VDSLIKSVEELNIYDGLIYASVRGSSSFIKKWNGTSWGNFSKGATDLYPTAMTTFYGSLYFSGNFSKAGNIPVTGTARRNGRHGPLLVLAFPTIAEHFTHISTASILSDNYSVECGKIVASCDPNEKVLASKRAMDIRQIKISLLLISLLNLYIFKIQEMIQHLMFLSSILYRPF